MSRGAFSFELRGVKEMMDLLEQLPTVSMQKTAVRNALKKAAQPVADLATQFVKEDHPQSKLLKDSIIVSTSLKASQKRGKFSDRSRVTVWVGSSNPVAHLVEWGTVARSTKSGKETGRMSPNPFMTRAWEQMKSTVVDILTVELREQIYNAARRLAKRAAAGKLTATQIRGLME